VERRSNGKLLCNVLDRLLKGYETKVDAEGVAVEPPLAKKVGEDALHPRRMTARLRNLLQMATVLRSALAQSR
jgi:hypothetical protein